MSKSITQYSMYSRAQQVHDPLQPLANATVPAAHVEDVWHEPPFFVHFFLVFSTHASARKKKKLCVD